MTLPTRDEAWRLVQEFLHQEYLLKHSLASEAVMHALALRLGYDATLWSITGLLHDLDLELIGEDMHRHAHETARILRERFDYPAEGLQAIVAHNGDVLGVPCATPLDHALTAAESITGLVFATALILPSKQLTDVKAKSVAKRIKEPRFAAKVSRERIGHHQNLGLEAEPFCELAVTAMQGAALS